MKSPCLFLLRAVLGTREPALLRLALKAMGVRPIIRKGLLLPTLLAAACLGARAQEIAPVRYVVPQVGLSAASVGSNLPRVTLKASALAPSLSPAVIPVLSAPIPAPTVIPQVQAWTAPTAPSPAGGGVALSAPVKSQGPAAVQTLSALASAAADPAKFVSRTGEVFENAQVFSAPSLSAPQAPRSQPQLPPGVKSVDVATVRSAADVERLIPNGENSDGLKAALKRTAGRMAPYGVYTYHDALGGTFTGIDLSARPDLVDAIPELQSHEGRLIKKIQVFSKDLRVLVREQGKTPDLVIGGLVTELKSLIGRSIDMTFLVNKANTQVLEHGRRHGLGHGAVAVDLTHLDEVPVELAERELSAWSRKTPAVVLDKVFVFAGRDMKTFVRQPDRSYKQTDLADPFGTGAAAGTIEPRDVHRVQLLASRGRLEDAQREMHRLESHAGGATAHSPLLQARERIEVERAYQRISKLLKRGQPGAARDRLANFRRTHSPEAASNLESRVKNFFGASEVSPGAAQFVREIQDPPKLLAARGVKAVVTVYGSARIPSPETARKRYEAAKAEWGDNPRTEAGKAALAEAEKALETSKYYEIAQRFGELVARGGEGKLAVVTGGGPGIMEAANRGASEAGGPSVGYNIKLPHEQAANPFITKGLSFDFENFATRKMSLRRDAKALVFFPGGFGTMDELFEILTLMQTGKMPKTPIVLVGHKEHWSKVLDFEHFSEMGLVSKGDLGLFKFAETAEEAWAVVSGAQPSLIPK